VVIHGRICFLVARGHGTFLVGLLAAKLPWIWMLPLSLPFVSLLIDEQCHGLKDDITAQLADSASELGLVEISADAKQDAHP
jgi:hypothetical protein